MKRVVFGGFLFLGGCLFYLSPHVSTTMSYSTMSAHAIIGLLMMILGFITGIMGIILKESDK